MKIKSIQHKNDLRKVQDAYVGDGYVKRRHGSLADVDTDFEPAQRDRVKHYLEKRYNLDGVNRVFSAGAYTTVKIKSAMKDVGRTYRLSPMVLNYLTKIIDDSECTWTDFMRLCTKEPKLLKYVQEHPEIYEEMLPILGQCRSASIHPSAVIITPEIVNGERVECFDLLPVKKMNDILVSELSGAEIDNIGILKNDVLSVEELTRLADMIRLTKEAYGKEYTLLSIITKHLNDPKVFEILKKGYTQGCFQISGPGMTKFVKRLGPDNIHELNACVALYRPGPLQSGSTDAYVAAKKGEIEPEYLWGTYEILKGTYGVMLYQEEISLVAQKVGQLSLADGVDLVKALSKKKLDKVRKFKEKFFDGANRQGCPIDAANKIWSNIEDAAKYSFNSSHSTSYGLTSYIGAWFKTHYPTVFYTVVLRDQNEEDLPALLREIESNSDVVLMSPNINISGRDFIADFKTNKIYWSIARVKQLGPKAVDYILKERQLFGKFNDLEDFIKRIFKNKFKSFNDDGTEEIRERCPVTARSVRNLIFAGAFDECEHVGSIMERYGIMEKAAALLGFEVTDNDIPDDMKDKHFFWERQQISLTGHGAVDYRRIFDNAERPKGLMSAKFLEFSDLNNMFCEIKRGALCATITSVTDKSYKDKATGVRKHFGKVCLQQNTETNILTIWDDWSYQKEMLKGMEGHILIALANVRWSDYDGKNTLSFSKGSQIMLL